MAQADSARRKQRRRRAWHPSSETDELVFAVCQRFLQNAAKSKKGVASEIARWVKLDYGRPDLNREKIYTLVWEGVRRGMVFFRPPCEQYLAQRIADIYGITEYEHDHERLQVVNVRGKAAFASVCEVGADLVLKLINKLKHHGRDPVHIGLGSGASAMNVAKRLAQLLRTEPECPGLVIHALSAGGFSLNSRKQDSPMAYFGLFEDVLPKVEFMGLFCPTVTAQESYAQLKQTVGVREPFEKRHEIDIVVTSLATRWDEHGLLQRFFNTVQAAEELRLLEEAGWVGEIQFRPFSRTAPIVTQRGVRAVTLFEIAELVELAGMPNKYVVLLSAPCLVCKETRAKAVQHLLGVPALRTWTHLVTDMQTALDLIQGVG